MRAAGGSAAPAPCPNQSARQAPPKPAQPFVLHGRTSDAAPQQGPPATASLQRDEADGSWTCGFRGSQVHAMSERMLGQGLCLAPVHCTIPTCWPPARSAHHTLDPYSTPSPCMHQHAWSPGPSTICRAALALRGLGAVRGPLLEKRGKHLGQGDTWQPNTGRPVIPLGPVAPVPLLTRREDRGAQRMPLPCCLRDAAAGWGAGNCLVPVRPGLAALSRYRCCFLGVKFAMNLAADLSSILSTAVDLPPRFWHLPT